jgi:hypothetical protein
MPVVIRPDESNDHHKPGERKQRGKNADFLIKCEIDVNAQHKSGQGHLFLARQGQKKKQQIRPLPFSDDKIKGGQQKKRDKYLRVVIFKIYIMQRRKHQISKAENQRQIFLMKIFPRDKKKGNRSGGKNEGLEYQQYPDIIAKPVNGGCHGVD